jgi:hypothetical protein
MAIIAFVGTFPAIHPLLMAVTAAGMKKVHSLLQLGIGKTLVVAAGTGQVRIIAQGGNLAGGQRLMPSVMMTGAAGQARLPMSTVIEDGRPFFTKNDRLARRQLIGARGDKASEAKGQGENESCCGQDVLFHGGPPFVVHSRVLRLHLPLSSTLMQTIA